MKKFLFSIVLIQSSACLLAQVDMHWNEIESGLHTDIQLFKGSGRIAGDTVTAYYSVTSIGNGSLTFYPLFSERNRKPEEWLSELGDDVVLLTNGGYFGLNVSYSMAMSNYTLHASNIRAVTRSHNGTNMSYYPTRSAFGIFSDLTSECGYVYSPTNDVTYIYPEPAPNSTDQPPLQQPGPAFPPGAIPWEVSDAIGGGPMLVLDSLPVGDYTPELFPGDITNSVAPRTAIGKRGNGELVNLVVDGRQEHSKGVSLQVLTDILLSLGCVEAMNLDGGGSSCMFMGDSLINQPSDGSTRSIPTAVAVLRATLPDASDREEFIMSAAPADSIVHEQFPWAKSYLFEEGMAGHFILKSGLPGGYRVEYALPAPSVSDHADSALLVLHRVEGLKDSVSIQPSAVDKNSLAFIGEFQLGMSDTLTVINLDPAHPMPVAGVRLTHTLSGLPLVDLTPAIYSGTHAYAEEIELTVQAGSINPARKIRRLAVYEQTGGHTGKLKDTMFSPVSEFTDSIRYTIGQKEGSVKIVFAVFDQLDDSVTVSYTVNVDDSPPTVSIGKNSMLVADVSDTLIFELQVRPAHTGRLLDVLTVTKNPASDNEELGRFTPLPTGDTIEFRYVIRSDDVPGIVFRFEIIDDAGYSSYRDYSHLVSQLRKYASDPLSIQFINHYTHMEIKAVESISTPVSFSVYTLTGRKILASDGGPGNHWRIDTGNLTPGPYILRMKSGSGSASVKFLHSASINDSR